VETRVYLPETHPKSDVAATGNWPASPRVESGGGNADRLEKMMNLWGDEVKSDWLAE
jgi:hypothetical protein